MEPEVQLEPQTSQQKPNLFITHRKTIIIGSVSIAIILIILIVSLFWVHPQTPPSPVQPHPETQNNTTSQSQVLVVSDASNITLTKVNNTALTKALTDAHTFFQPNIHTVTFHLTDVPLTDPNSYMQRFLDSTKKILQGGFYATTTPSTMTEDIYIYNGQTSNSTSSTLISSQFWTYMLGSIWYVANIQAYKSTDVNQLETLSNEQYQFIQAHKANPITVTVQ